MELKPLVGLTPEVLITILNTFVLFLILKKILFVPVMKIIDERESDINSDIEFGKKAKEEGLKYKAEYEEKLLEAKKEGQDIIEAARKKAEKRSDEIIYKAKKDAIDIKEKASKDIEKERKEAYNSVKKDISDLALLAASKVIEKDIDKQKHEDLINEFINEVGDAR